MIIIVTKQKLNKNIVEINNRTKEGAFKTLLFHTFSDLQSRIAKIIQIFRKDIDINFLEKKQTKSICPN